MHTGSCLCDAVSFEITGPLRDVLGCHCQQCRKQSGHYWAATSVADDALRFIRQEGLTWYNASATARRGFCKFCGSTLFWKPVGADRTAVGAGSLDTPTGLRLTRHVFMADKGSYYDIADGTPQHAQFSGEEDA
ncbi:MAG: GFA family protein [Roseovarius sp.]